MAAVTASLCCSLLFVFVLVSAEKKTITADPGQNVTLTCRAPNYNNIVTKWSRADLEPKYVLLYRDGHFVPDLQHPSLKNRVDLQDRQMKDGDVSLILKNVTTTDAGTYECRVVQRVRERLKLISTITLVVVAPPGQPGGTTEDEEEEDGDKQDEEEEDGDEQDEEEEDGDEQDEEEEDGSVGLIVGLPVSALLLVVAAVVGFVVYRKHKQQQNQDSYSPPVYLHPVSNISEFSS